MPINKERCHKMSFLLATKSLPKADFHIRKSKNPNNQTKLLILFANIISKYRSFKHKITLVAWQKRLVLKFQPLCEVEYQLPEIVISCRLKIFIYLSPQKED